MVNLISTTKKRINGDLQRLFLVEVTEFELAFIEDCIRCVESEFDLDSHAAFETWKEIKDILEKKE